MALWNKLLQSRPEVMEQIRISYGNHFPMEVRHYLCDWLENRLLSGHSIVLDHDPQFEIEAASFLNELIQELERKSSEMSADEHITARLRLIESARNFRQLFSHNPSQLYSHLRNCLMFEKQMLCYPEEYAMTQNTEFTQIFQAIETLMTSVRSNEIDNRNLKKKYELFCCELHEVTKNNAQYDAMDNTSPDNRERIASLRQQQQASLQTSLNQLTGMRLSLVDKFKSTNEMTETVQAKVIDKYLNQWRMNQGLAGNGAPPSNANNLDIIQGWCESLAEILWSTREQIKMVSKYRKQLNVDEQNLPDFLPELFTQSTRLLEHLITRSFIIEKQPPQVMKTNTRFASTVRLLIGNTLNIKMNSPLVKVTIVSEAQAQLTQQTNKFSEHSCGEILNSTGNMEYNETTKQLSVSFRNMQLKKIKRAEKKGTESVMDEKFALLFQSGFTIGNGELKFSVWALSLPVVVIVHGNQEPQSWATITWDNAFAEINRTPFVVPDKVPWPRLAEALNMKFRASTGRCLTAENLHFLGEKVFKQNIMSQITDDYQISWSAFCKEPLPDRTFTFWEWFYATMKLTREHLRGPWNDGSIIGFIQKKTAEDHLKKLSRGTFLLRFSDSELGGITIAWCSDGSDGQPCVLHIQPFTSKDFSTRSLSDRIRDYDDLTILFPNKSKSESFDKYATPSVVPKNKDYIPSDIKAILPTSNSNGTSIYGGTPAHFMQSPDPSRDTPSVQSGYGMDDSHNIPQMNQLGETFDFAALDNIDMAIDSNMANIGNMSDMSSMWNNGT